MTSRPRVRWGTISALVGAVATALLASPATATPPGIPSKSTAHSRLNVPSEAALSRTEHRERPCNTRETVLERDGTSVITDSSCSATSGRWYDLFDGAVDARRVCLPVAH